MSDEFDLLDKVGRLKLIVTKQATGKHCEDEDHTDYISIRRELMGSSRVREKLPRFVINCRTLDEIWSYIQPLYAHYSERRKHIQEELAPVLEMLEIESLTPGDVIISATLSTIDSHHIKVSWEKALERRRADPDGAITSARTLLESVCKFILENKNEEHDDKMDLPNLYSRTASALNIAPSQQTDSIMRQVLGGCQNVVQGLGALRNKLGDAHGKGSASVLATPIHAEFAVNIAGAMALFLVKTWQETN